MSKKILVVGDSMLDMRIDCEVTRISPEAPIPIYDVDHEQCYAGGAANVALNINAMGGDVTLLLPHGQDAAGTSLLDILVSSELRHIPCLVERTTTKTRLFVDRVARVRVDQDHILSEDEDARVLEYFLNIAHTYDYIVFSDYGKGALRQCDVMLDHCAHSSMCTVVDPKGANWGKYTGATYIKANAAEVEATHTPLHLVPHEYSNAALIRTAGGAGSQIIPRRGNSVHIPPLLCDSVDPTGAGDSYLAALVVALADGMHVHNACRRASVAGALATRHVGTAVITKEEIDECLPKLSSNTTQQ